MQPTRLLLAACSLSAAAASQVNAFVFYPQDPQRQTVTCTSYVGRPDWNLAAEALMEIDLQHFRGIGDANGFPRLFGTYHWVADENLSTVETYDLVVRAGAVGGGPDMSGAAEHLRIANLTTPPSPNPQRGTWIMYDGFNLQGGLALYNGYQPAGRLYVGVYLPANPLWPATDGHSLFRADMIGANTPATVGENERLGAPNPTWAGLQGAQSFSTPWTYILGPFVTTPNLHVGGVDPLSGRLGAPGANFGLNGLYPDVSGNPRSDGIVVRVTDHLAPFGLCFLGAGLGLQNPYFAFNYYPTLIGSSHIGDPTSPPISLAVTQLQNEVFEYTVALPGTIPAAIVGTELAFQAVVWDTNIGLADWTNAQAVHF